MSEAAIVILEEKMIEDNNKNNKRKALDTLEDTTTESNKQPKQEVIIESLDGSSSSSSTTIPDEIKTTEENHTYFEPRWLSDIEVHYQGHIFHCHRNQLYTFSMYFRTLLSLDKECNKVEIPYLKTSILEIDITIEDFKAFFSVEPSTVRIIPNAYLCHYFEAKAETINFQLDCLASKVSINWIQHVIAAIEYKWTEKNKFLDRVVNNLPSYMVYFDSIKPVWRQIPISLQRDIYLMYINKQCSHLIKIPPKLLRITS